MLNLPHMTDSKTRRLQSEKEIRIHRDSTTPEMPKEMVGGLLWLNFTEDVHLQLVSEK